MPFGALFDLICIRLMKKPAMYEAAAVIFGFVGAMVLVSGLMPFINPGFADANETGEYSPRMLFLIPTLLSLPIFGVSWHFNKKAQAIRRELQNSANNSEAPWKKKLKWVMFGIIVLLLLSGFLGF
jgi:ABC-type sugar transport system permease subunit